MKIVILFFPVVVLCLISVILLPVPSLSGTSDRRSFTPSTSKELSYSVERNSSESDTMLEFVDLKMAGISHSVILSCHPKRWRWMEYKMRKSELCIARYGAVLVDGPEWGNYSHLLKPRSGNYLINSPTALALLGTWRTLVSRCSLSSDCTNLLVLEDDVYFLENFQKHLVEAVNISRGKDFELTHIGMNCFEPCSLMEFPHATHEDLERLHMSTNVQIVEKRGTVWGTFGLILSRRLILAVHESLKDLSKVNLPIDDHLAMIVEKHRFKSGICFPSLVIPETRDSTNMGDAHANFAEFVRARLHVPTISRYILAAQYEELTKSSLDPSVTFPKEHILHDFPQYFHSHGSNFSR